MTTWKCEMSNAEQVEAAHLPLLASAYLSSLWADEYAEFRESKEAQVLFERLEHRAAQLWQKETAAEGTLVDVFFEQIWGYRASGEGARGQGVTLQQQYPVKNADQSGGTGEADVAMGFFGCDDREGVPQVLGEFKVLDSILAILWRLTH